MRTLSRSLSALVAFAVVAAANADFTEDYGSGTNDVGDWGLTIQMPRDVRTSGGNPGGYLYGEVTTAVPAWVTVSTGFQPGLNDSGKRDSVFTGDYYDRGVTSLSADVNVFGYGSWTEGRAMTLRLLQMDDTGFDVNYEATFTLPMESPTPEPTLTPPVGWNTYAFDLNATGGAAPAGWTFTRGDGTEAKAAEWATFMKKIDFAEFGLFTPGYAYPSHGTFKLGLDNVTIKTQAVPEPGTFAAMALGGLALIRRRKK